MGSLTAGVDENPNTFDKALLETMTPNPATGPSNPVVLPPGGPHTAESAISDTERANREGRSGRRVPRSFTRFELTDDAQDLDNEFTSMLQGDYGKRCQICGSSFLTRKGELQGFADHIVAPSKSSRTNHFGNLLSLCGWHYALITHGQWVLLECKAGNPIEQSATALNAEEDLRDSLLAACEEIHSEVDPYIVIHVRFWNVYRRWRADPEPIDEKIRFSVPHWTYLCELLKT